MGGPKCKVWTFNKNFDPVNMNLTVAHNYNTLDQHSGLNIYWISPRAYV